MNFNNLVVKFSKRVVRVCAEALITMVEQSTNPTRKRNHTQIVTWPGKLVYFYRKETRFSFSSPPCNSDELHITSINIMLTFLSPKNLYLSQQESSGTVTKIPMTMNPLGLDSLG